MMLRERNPFQITTPEDLDASEAVSLFVDVFTDFFKVVDTGHVFIIGPRGVGKSMMFRYLQPDCQCLAKDQAFSELPFLGVYVPLKRENTNITELERLENRHASDILNEHILATYCAIWAFDTLSNPKLFSANTVCIADVLRFYNEVFLPTARKFSDTDRLQGVSSPDKVFCEAKKVVEHYYCYALDYARRLAFMSDLPPYEEPLFDYSRFLLPLLTELSKIRGFPKGPIYLLIDDAHCLTTTQTRILNSWVATRTSFRVSLKISTQYNYKTYYTTNGSMIDTPHDYTEIDMTTIFTGNSKTKYRSRIADIVRKRLEASGLPGISAEMFFPEDKEQENTIAQIANEYRELHDRGEGRGHYRGDDALRYARPDFIRDLAGPRKSSSTYSYAGFDQLVHLSSGIVRHFIHPAHLMYAEARKQLPEEKITSISPSIQNYVVREEAVGFLFSNLERIQTKGHEDAPPREDIDRLSNLIQGLGGLFRQILLSNRAERRVFSIAFSDEPSDLTDHILDLGVQLGYFHRSTIGRKDSKSGGRTRLYVLNRRLAPIWNLDPNGFSGYLFVTNRMIEEAMQYPTSLLRRLGRDGVPGKGDPVQLQFRLFEEGERDQAD